MKTKKLAVCVLAVLTAFSAGAASVNAAENSAEFSLRIEGVSGNIYYSTVAMDKSVYPSPTVGDLLSLADGQSDDLTIKGVEEGFVKEVNGEKAGNYNPSKFDGWYYTVNGVSPDVGINDYVLSEGADVVLYYGDYPCYSPNINTDWFSANGTITFTADSTEYVYDDSTGQWNVIKSTVPLSDMTVVLNNSLTYTTDENGSIKADLNSLFAADSRVSLQVNKTSVYGAPAVCRYAPDFTIAAPDRSCGLYGDADLSGSVNIKDVSLIQSYCAKIEEITPQAYIAADVDCSFDVNVFDISYIQQTIAKLISLPVTATA